MRSVVGIACAVLLLGVAGWEIITTRLAATGAPDDAAWQRAAAVVRAEHRTGDLITFAPRWVDPIGRLHLGDLIPIAMASRMDDARYARVWELSIRDAHDRAQPAFETLIDGIRVRRYDRTPVTVLADVLEIAGAHAEVSEVGFEPHRCIKLVPPARLVMQLPAGTLVGYAGIADVFTRRDHRVPGRLTIEVGGKAVAQVVAGVDDGWVRFEAKLAGGEVTFVGTERQLCFAAEVRP